MSFKILIFVSCIVAAIGIGFLRGNAADRETSVVANRTFVESSRGRESSDRPVDRVDPTKVFGRIQLVTSFPDYQVQVVDSFPDLRVTRVGSCPDSSGKWQLVDSFPDYQVQIVDSFPDFTIQWESK